LKTLEDIVDYDYYYTVPNAPEVLVQDIRLAAREWIKELDDDKFTSDFFASLFPFYNPSILQLTRDGDNIIEYFIKHFFNLEDK